MAVRSANPASSPQADGPTSKASLLDSQFVLLALAAAIAVYALLATLIVRLWTPESPDNSFLLPEIQAMCQPEPVERLLYLLGLASAAVLPPLFYFGLVSLDRRWPAAFTFWTSTPVLFARDCVLLIGFLAWLVVIGYHSELVSVTAWVVLALVLVGLLSPRFWDWIASLKPSKIYFGAVLLLLVCLSKVMVCDDREFQEGGDLMHHLDVLMAPIYQVSLGKTILVDTSSQYGTLYPYVVDWLLKPFGIGVTSMCFVFAGIAFFTALFVYLAIGKKVGRDSPLALLLFVAFLGLAHPSGDGTLLFHWDSKGVYFQYYPLRVIEPAFYFWLVKCYFDRPKRWLLLVGYLLAGLGVFWNFDTGGVVLIAWTLTQMYSEWTRRENLARVALRCGGQLALGAFSLLIATGLYWSFARLRSGQFPELSELTAYQQRFYLLGVTMLPLPVFEWWQVPALFYVGVGFYCVRRSFARDAAPDNPWYFFIALVGLGIFSYYQGRSHALNILHIVHPAALLCCLLTVDMQRRLGAVRWREAFGDPSLRFDALRLLALDLMLAVGLWAGVVGIGFNLYRFVGHRIAWRDQPQFGLDYAEARTLLQGAPTLILTGHPTFDHLETGAVPGTSFSTPHDIVTWQDLRVVQDALDRGAIRYVITPREDRGIQAFTELRGELNFDRFEIVKRLTLFSIWQRKADVAPR
jgi:hypothetical protein